MEALKWLCVTVVVVVCSSSMLKLSSASVLNVCRAQCREEEQLKAACSEERNCPSLLPNLSAFVDCLEPCTNLGNNCFQRCAFKTDRIASICASQCQLESAPSAAGRSLPLPGDVSSSAGNNAEEEEAGVMCYKTCYDSLLNAAMNRLYTKRI